MKNSILGACVGDAAGATLEWHRADIPEEMALKAMTMPGGGGLRVGPGQITDDGELTLAIWNAIQGHHPKDGLPVTSLLQSYAHWYLSCPFDIGRTCSLAFDEIRSFLKNPNGATLEHLKQEIFNTNKYSEANGALMRASALATWIAQYPDVSAEVGAELAMEDALLSHPNPVCQDTNAIYVFTIINLLRGVSPQDALKYTDEFVKMNDFYDKVKDWYFEESLDISTMDAKQQCGHVRWGFVLAFYFLRHPEITYEEAIKNTLMKGGDTDTNAAIVGGLIGAYHNIPDYMKNPVLAFDCTKQNHLRPIEYSVQKVLGASLGL